MSFLGLSGHQPPSTPDPPRDRDSEDVGLPPELGDDTPLGRLVRFLIAAVLGGLVAVPLSLIPSVAIDVGQGFAGSFPKVQSVADRIAGAAVLIGLGIGLVAGCCAAIGGDRFLAPVFRYLRRSGTRT